jgi:hypothetical protein
VESVNGKRKKVCTRVPYFLRVFGSSAYKYHQKPRKAVVIVQRSVPITTGALRSTLTTDSVRFITFHRCQSFNGPFPSRLELSVPCSRPTLSLTWQVARSFLSTNNSLAERAYDTSTAALNSVVELDRQIEWNVIINGQTAGDRAGPQCLLATGTVPKILCNLIAHMRMYSRSTLLYYRVLYSTLDLLYRR